MATFASLKTEVQTLLIDAPTAVTSLTGTWVNRAMNKLMTKHNFKCMEYEVSYTTTFGSRILVGNRPADWKSPRGKPYYVEDLGGFREFGYAPSRAEALARWGNNVDLDIGDPRMIFEDDTNNRFEVYPYPDAMSDYSDGEYRITVPYWRYLDPLSADADTNWFTTNAEQWLIFQAVAEGFYANEDEARAQTWETRARMEYKDVVGFDKERRLSEMQSLIPHLGARMPHTEE